MKLYYSKASPFVRKVRVVALEKGIPLQLVEAAPFDNPTELLAANPLGKIPALELDDGRVLCDSALICEYLETLKPESRLLPAQGDARLDVLRREYLGIGVLEAAVKLVIERRRPAGTQWNVWVERQENAIRRSLAALEAELPRFSEALSLDQITLGVALGYLDFRHDYLAWRLERPALAEWYVAFSARRSMQETVPAT